MYLQKMKFIALITTFILTGFIFISTSASYAANSYTIANTSSLVITEHGVCKNVTNNTGSSIMVPTKTANEWSTGGSSFLENPPAGVTLSTGCCGGYLYQGYCYRIGGDEESCATACSGFSGCNSAGTLNITNSWAKCKNVAANVLGSAPSTQFSGSQGGIPAGCYYYATGIPGDALWQGVVGAGCSAGTGGIWPKQRFCACND